MGNRASRAVTRAALLREIVAVQASLWAGEVVELHTGWEILLIEAGGYRLLGSRKISSVRALVGLLGSRECIHTLGRLEEAWRSIQDRRTKN